jgi:alpha-tubulin suppressor-like RCC1 family protein
MQELRDFYGTSALKSLSAGGKNTAVITTDSHLYVCGHGTHGQLGFGDSTSRVTLSHVESAPLVRQVSCGKNHTAIVAYDGGIFAWGENYYGELGLGTHLSRLIPTPVQIPEKGIH